MGSDPAAAAEAVRLAAAVAAAFAGLACAAGLRSLFRPGVGKAGRRFAAATLASSAAVAAGAWSLVSVARSGAFPDYFILYAACGLAVGLLAGLFPRAAGLPCLAYGVLATAVAGAGLSSWLPWSAGAEAARLTAYSATGAGSMCAVRVRAAGGLSTERNITLGAGDIVVEFDIVEIRGPFSLPFGTRRYRPSAIGAGGTRVALSGDVASIIGPDRIRGEGSASEAVAALIGCSVSTLSAPPFEPSALATATYVMSGDGAIELTTR